MAKYEICAKPKTLREALCLAQGALSQFTVYSNDDLNQVMRAREVLEHLIDECDRKRPLGPDGKHDDRHTPECGCEVAND